MLRRSILVTLFVAIAHAAAAQALSVLHIKVVLIDAEGKAMAVPHHALLISDNPASAAPRRIVTRLDGTADVKLRPGNYTVESDRPVAFQGKAYQWTQTLDIPAGRETALELTADNAEVGPLTSTTASAAPLEVDPSSVLIEWQDSVVAIWTPTTHASGFVVDARGLIATSQRVIGTATSVEVQVTPVVKVAASVLAADAVRDIAILRIDPKVLASARPVPLACGQPRKPVAAGQELFTIGTPLRGPKSAAQGTISRVEAHAIVSDLILATGSAGGPVFSAGGDLIGLTTVADDGDEGRRRVIRVDDACDLIAAVERKMSATQPPPGAHLPVEPTRPFPPDALKEAVQRRAGSLLPYQISSSDFEIAFITPVLNYGAQYPPEHASGRERGKGARSADAAQTLVSQLVDFGYWSEYVQDVPAVLLVRVTPKSVEGFWTTVARGAARTQGVNLPPLKHFKSGFSRMRAFCGSAEVMPIHPFRVERRVSETDATYEGLYVFDPGALGPHCGTVKLLLYSEKAPEKGDTRVIDPKVLEQVWQDFAPYRTSASPPSR
jgi:S1-C subfamily serine protease